MDFRPLTAQDLPQAMHIIEAARAFLKRSGVDQWQTGYPSREDLLGDIRDGIGYVLEGNGMIAATLALSFEGEPAYDLIQDGQWLSEQPYAVIHRMAVSEAYRGKGMAKLIFTEVESLCHVRGICSIKIDTHQDNPIMNGLLTRLGFQYCGIIQFEGAGRLAYEKLLPADCAQ